jgi:D-psicose/D-tagatose/L-ribulose 3-epimerase
MKFGVNTFLFTSPFTDESTGILKMIRELGFDGVEISLENVGDFDYRKTLKALKDNGLVCCSVCGFFSKERDLRGTQSQQDTSKRYIMECIDACSALECDLLVGPFYSAIGRARKETEEAREEQWRVVVQNLKEICTYGKERGIYLALEPMNRGATDFMNTCRQAIDMIKDVGSPMLKIHLDTYHMNIEEKSAPMAILDAGSDLFDIHVSENDRGTPGTGSINWIGIRNALVRTGYDRYVVIEAFTPEIPVGGLAASIWRSTEKSNVDLARKGLSFLKALFTE